MTTATQDAPAKETTAPAITAFDLGKHRPAPKKGMPTDGFILIAGLAKGGKTTIAASIPDAIILELEKGGADRVDGWIKEISDLPTFRQAFMAAIKAPEAKVIVIDTLDVLLDWLSDDVAHEFGLANISDRKEGVNGFAVSEELNARITGLVRRIKDCGKLVVALAHFKEPKLDNEGRLVISHNINARGKTGSYICGQADVIGHAFKRPMGTDTQYVLSFQGGGTLGTFGGRVAELEGKIIILPRTEQWSAVEAIFKAPTPAPVENKAEKSAKGKGGK